MGLIGGMARTAVIAGTATAVSNRVSRRQAGRWAAQDEQAYQAQQYQAQQQYAQQPAPPPVYAAPPPTPPEPDRPDPEQLIEQLQKLGELRDQGILTDAEFEVQKARLLR